MAGMNADRSKGRGAALVLLYVLALAAFYLKYVPLVPAFQIVLLPVLVAVAAAAAIEARRGLLAVIFILPLINNLPYFFGLTEPLPFAPTALLLFLFFFGGWLVRGAGEGLAAPIPEPVFRPLGLAALLVTVSAAVAFWRYAAFFPIGTGRVLEWPVNAHGVTSGGAFMSVLFFALNYLTSFAFFLVFLRTDRSKGFALKALATLGAGGLLACAFGFVQLAGNLAFGNNPQSIVNGIINATFKDALAFGCFLSMIIPLSLGGVLASRGLKRAAAALLAAASAVLILAAGSKSAFLGLFVGLAGFACLAAGTALRKRRESAGKWPVRRWAVVLLIAAIAGGGIGFLAVRTGLGKRVLSMRTMERLPRTKLHLEQRLNTVWRLAGEGIAAYPLTGLGVGGYIIESSNYAAVTGVKIAMPDSAENYFLQVAAEMGLPGLVVFLWIFWEIFRKARAAWRKAPLRGPERWILAGTVSGILAYVFNLLTHSYIGSYEIKYIFWLFAAAVFILGGGPEAASETAGASAARRRSRRTTAAFVAAFGLAHLWSSAHGLSLDRTTVRFPVPKEIGLGRMEKTDDGREFRWTREYGGVPVAAASSALVVPVHASHPDIAARPVRVRISLRPDVFRAGPVLKVLVLETWEWRDVELPIPAADVGKRRILFFEVDRTWNPSKTTGAPDSRDLGLAVGPVRSR
jgi:hypothetical protein